MKDSLKKRGQKFIKKFSKASLKASEEGKEHIKENLFQRFSHIANIKLLILEWGLLATALIMLAIAQSFWFGESYAEDVWTNGGTYTEATLGEVKSMNPLFATSNSEKTLSRLMFATIAAIDYSGHPGAQLARSIHASEDGKVWTIQLRDDLKWSDGEPLTNEDVMFTLDLITNPAVNTVYDSNLSNVKISEGENGEIVFTLPNPYADFISALIIPIVPKHALEDSDPKMLIEDSFSNSPITSGPFKINATQNSSISDEQTIYLSPNEYYFKDGAMLNSFAVHTFDDKKNIIDALNSGLVTASAELSEADAERISSSQIIEKNSNVNSGVFAFFNTKNENVKNKSLREAIRLGIDLNKIREAVPDCTVLNYPLLESQIKLSNYPGLPNHDLESAKAKIAEITGGEQVTLELVTVNTGVLPEVARIFSEELSALGLNVNLSTYDENQEFISNILSKRSYDILIYEIELGTDPDPLAYYHSSQASTSGLNLSNYRNALVDDLLLAGRETLDESLRIKKYESFLGYWVADVPAIGLYQPNLTYYYNRNVRAFSDSNRLSTSLDRFSDVTSWAVNTTTKNKTP